MSEVMEKECCEVKFGKDGWRGHEGGSTALLSLDRAIELHEAGICTITAEGKKCCEKAKRTYDDPKKRAAT